MSVSAVAKAAGVGRPTVYRRHQDAESLAAAVLLADLEVVAVRRIDEVPRQGPFLDQVLALVAPIYHYYAQHPPMSAALLRVAMFRSQGLDDPLTSQLSGFLEDIALRFVAAQQGGELRPSADAATFVGAFFAMYLSCTLLIVHRTVEDPDQVLAVLAGMLRQHLDGVRA